jgi:transcriptional regulator with XRE-family HTH domain
MLTTTELLEAAKARQGISSDYRLAQILGVGRTAIANYRAGRSSPDDAVCIKLAELTGHDAGIVAVWMQAERSRDQSSRSMWEGIAARLERAGLAAVAAVVLAVGLGLASNDAEAGATPYAGGSVYYVKWLVWLAQRLRCLAALRQSPLRRTSGPALA